jgi:hypothetical protein
LAVGNYTLTVTDSKGCTRSNIYTVTQPASLSITTTITHVTCNNAANGIIAVNPTGGNPGYNYLWIGGNTIQTRTNLAPGTYTVTVTDTKGCTTTKSSAITQPSALSLSLTSTKDTCNIGRGKVTATLSGGTSPYTYYWNNGAAINPNVNLLSGTYTVTATDSKGCTKTGSATVTNLNAAPPTPSAIYGSNTGVCNKTNMVYTSAIVTSANYYQWSVPAGCTIVSGQGTSTLTINFLSNFSSGSITVAAKNNCGTSSSKSFSIIAKPGAAGTITAPATICKNQIGVPFSIAAVYGATNYNWTVPSGSSVATGQGTNSVTVNFGTSTGSVTVTPSNSCGSGASKSKSVKFGCRGYEIISNDYLEIMPNPFTESTTVQFGISKETPVKIEVFDVLGILIYSNGNQINFVEKAGEYSFELDNEELGDTKGLIYIRLTLNDKVLSIKAERY